MIIWLASYPRSGNTLLRTILNRVYGAKSYSKYNDKTDIGQSPDTAAAVGHIDYQGPWNEAYEAFSKSTQTYFVKTHDAPEDDSAAIYIVRNGIKALVSNYHYWKDFNNKILPFEDLILGTQTPFPSWGGHLDAWRPDKRSRTLVLRYEDLIADPSSEIRKITNFIRMPELAPWINDFNNLQKINPRFFREGKTTPRKAEISDQHENLFNAIHEDWMRHFNYATRNQNTHAIVRNFFQTAQQFSSSQLKVQYDTLVSTVHEQTRYIKSLETERDSYRTNYTRVVSESERHLASLAEQASFIAQLQSSLAEKDQALTHLHQQMDEKSAYIASLAAERDALRQDNERILAESRRHLDSLAEQDRFISQLKKQRADLEVFVASLRDKLDTLGRTTVEQAAYIDTLKAECEQSKREHASTLSQLAAEPRTSTEVIQKQTSYIASLEAEREQLQHDNTRILAESKRHQASLAEQEHFIVQLKQQNAKLVAETESLRAQLDKLSHTVVEQTSCIDALKAECALTKREYASLEQQLAADKAQAASEYEKLQARLEKASAHAIAQEQDIALLKKMHARQASHTRYLIDTLSPQHTSHPPPRASS